LIKIGIYGARGRMGQELCNLVQQNSKTSLEALFETPGHSEIGQEFYGLTLKSDIRSLLDKSDVVIDFTSPQGTMQLLELNGEFKKPLVIGTTGLSPEEEGKIKNAAARYPVVFSPNYSIGINLLLKLVREAGRVLSKEKGYDLEIIELHHRFKKDAPSGTALKLGEIAAEASGRNLAKDGIYGREGQVGERSIDEVGIFAVRGGDIVGEHTVLFTNLGERVEIGHKAHSRQTLASGAVEAAIWVKNRKPGEYSMEDVLDLK
jgi:4-hydroxy-tetrahydrodipicolinate reductase